MRPIEVHPKAASVGVPPTPITATSWLESSWNALWLIWTRIELNPAIAFVFLSFAFGSLVTFVTPPLRGPDEISHFLRIYSYARGELLPTAEVDGRKGIFVERALYEQLSFFRSAAEWFATARENDVRYRQVMALYRDVAGRIDDDSDQAAIFAPFAGTEGYTPIAYVPYIAAAAIGHLLKLDVPELLLLPRGRMRCWRWRWRDKGNVAPAALSPCARLPAEKSGRIGKLLATFQREEDLNGPIQPDH